MSVPGLKIVPDWHGSAAKTEPALHQLSPYIGKIKSTMAASLVASFTKKGDLLLDPFSGSGTVALEGWSAGRHVIASDLSPYACLLTRAKLFPYKSLPAALKDVERAAALVEKEPVADLRRVPQWVREFFHPETLREALAWTTVLRESECHFLLACLLGILHHQRPGFLSFPSSHTVPYLRIKRFPRWRYPKLYEYRSLRDRLEKKVTRAFRRMPALDFSMTRTCLAASATTLTVTERVDAIITSPPYMRQLDYGRDNRLRLWFLGERDWESLDKEISPRKAEFLKLMKECFVGWKTVLKRDHLCVLVIGDTCSREDRSDLPETVARIATDEVGGYSAEFRHTETIPNERRVRRGITGSSAETILVLRNTR